MLNACIYQKDFLLSHDIRFLADASKMAKQSDIVADVAVKPAVSVAAGGKRKRKPIQSNQPDADPTSVTGADGVCGRGASGNQGLGQSPRGPDITQHDKKGKSGKRAPKAGKY